MAPTLLLVALAGAATVSAHGYIEKITVESTSFSGYNPSIAPWVAVQDSPGWQNWATDLGFVSSTAAGLSSVDIICHRNSTNAPKIVPVVAGSEVVLKWNGWPDSHKGPIMDYLARCSNDDCTTVDKTTLEWFKIAETGQIELGKGNGATGRWAPDILFDTDFTWTVKIPSEIAPGSYVLRHEILALHSAYAEGGAQFYPQCINLEVSGSGTATPSGVAATELYDSKDPSVIYNIYNDETKPTYKIPGPPLCKSNFSTMTRYC